MIEYFRIKDYIQDIPRTEQSGRSVSPFNRTQDRSRNMTPIKDKNQYSINSSPSSTSLFPNKNQANSRDVSPSLRTNTLTSKPLSAKFDPNSPNSYKRTCFLEEKSVLFLNSGKASASRIYTRKNFKKSISFFDGKL